MVLPFFNFNVSGQHSEDKKQRQTGRIPYFFITAFLLLTENESCCPFDALQAQKDFHLVSVLPKNTEGALLCAAKDGIFRVRTRNGILTWRFVCAPQEVRGMVLCVPNLPSRGTNNTGNAGPHGDSPDRCPVATIQTARVQSSAPRHPVAPTLSSPPSRPS